MGNADPKRKTNLKTGDWPVKVLVWKSLARNPKNRSAIQREFELNAGKESYPERPPDRQTITKICNELRTLSPELISQLPPEIQAYAQELNPELSSRLEKLKTDEIGITERAKPHLIIKTVKKPPDFDPSRVIDNCYFSHFEIENNGNAPAVTITIRLVDINNKDLGLLLLSLLRAGDSTEYDPFTSDVEIKKEGSKFYLVCEYEPMYESNRSRTTLPFNIFPADEPGKLYITPGELTFSK